MNKKAEELNDIDLISVLVKIWKNKIKVLFITFVCLILAFIFLNFKKDTTQFTTKTTIKAIPFLEENK